MKQLALIAVLLVACGSEDQPLCDAALLRAALDGAGSGSTVTFGACTVSGRFTVHAGTTLMGSDRAASIIQSNEHAALVLEPGATIANLSVDSSGTAGVYAQGAGAVTIHDVTVTVAKSVGIAIADATNVDLARTIIQGPITAAIASGIPYPAPPDRVATHGLILQNVAQATLDELDISGFAMAGAAIVSSTTSWIAGLVHDNLTLGVIVEGGHASFDSTELSRSFQGTRGLGPFNAVFTSGAFVESTSLAVEDSEGYGLVQDSARAVHDNLFAMHNARAAVWTQNSPSVEVSGQLTDNTLAAVYVIDTDEVRIHDANLSATTLGFVPNGQLGITRAGDGVQLVRAVQHAELVDLLLDANQRVGILIDLDGATLPAMTLDRITVTTANGTEHGVIAQNGVTPMGWDSGVTRTNVNAADDYAAAGSLDIVEAVGPCGRPSDTASQIMGQLGP